MLLPLTPTKLAFHLIAASLLTLCALHPSFLGAQDVADTQQRWAIVPIDEEGRALADLLLAELSTWDNVQLLERERIVDVLAELELSAGQLQDGDAAMQLGKLSQADALALIDVPTKDNQAKSIRLRLVDARTSIRLLDVLLPPRGLEAEVTAIHDELRRAHATLRVPFEELRLIGVMPIKSEEPGEFLKPFCRTLTKLVEVSLQRQPEIIVLERSDLQRLTAETELTGAELKLRGATRLLEVGIRRAEDGKRMLVTCRVVSPAIRQGQTHRISAASQEMSDVRQAIVAAALRSVGENVRAPQRVAPEVEAKVFDRRGDWFNKAYRFEDAAEMAETAFALAPTPKRLRKLLQNYSSWSHTRNSSRQSNEAIPPALSYHRLRLSWLKRTKPNDTMRRGLDLRYAFRPHSRIPHTGESKHDQLLRAELDATCLRTFDILFAEANGNPSRQFAMLLEKLEYSVYLSETGRRFVEMFPDLLEDMIATMKAIHVVQNPENATYAKFARLLFIAVGKAYASVNSGRGMDEHVWDAAELNGFPERLKKSGDPAMYVASLYARLLQPGKTDKPAAVELLAFTREWPRLQLGQLGVLQELAVRRLKGTIEIHEYFSRMLDAAERKRNPTRVIRSGGLLFTHLSQIPKDKKLRLADRIDAILKFANKADQKEAVRLLRFRVRQHLLNSGIVLPSVFSLQDAPGPWQEYSAIPIRITNVSPENFALRTVRVVRDAKARQADNILLVWQRGDKMISIERIGIEGGTPFKIGADIPGQPLWLSSIHIAVSPDATFVGSKSAGFAMMKGNSYETFTEAQGAPSNVVWQLAWWRDRLYISYSDAFASFDPVTKKFQLLASSVSVKPRNPLDSRGSFFIRSLIADEANSCLWVAVQDNALPRDRNGVWKCDPESNSYRRISDRYVSSASLAGDDLFLASWYHKPFAKLRRDSAEVTKLTNYAPWQMIRLGPATSPRFVKVGDHIISAHRQLYAPDGNVYQADGDVVWPLLQRVGSGFITHYDEKTKTLWYVEPKTASGK